MVAFVSGTVLTAAALNTAFNSLTTRAVTGTTDTLVLADNGGMVTFRNSTAITLTIPTYSSVAFATGTVIRLLNMGAGAVTISGAGVTINGTTTVATNESVLLYKQATNTWYVANPPGGGGGGLDSFLLMGA